MTQFFSADSAIHEAQECVVLALNEIDPFPAYRPEDVLSRPLITSDGVAHLTRNLDGSGYQGGSAADSCPVVWAIALRKGVLKPSYHFSGDEDKVRDKIARGHRPVFVEATWDGNVLSGETELLLIAIDDARIDPRVRESLRSLYAARFA